MGGGEGVWIFGVVRLGCD